MSAALLWRLWLNGMAPEWAQADADDAESDALVTWALDEYQRRTGRM